MPNKIISLIIFILAIILIVVVSQDQNFTPTTTTPQQSAIESDNNAFSPSSPKIPPITLEEIVEPDEQIESIEPAQQPQSSSSAQSSSQELVASEPQYQLQGEGCDQNQLNTNCELFLAGTKITTLKSCISGSDEGCNLYFYSLQDQTDSELFIFKEFSGTNDIDYLEVLSLDKSSKLISLVNSYINDPSLPQSVADYEEAKKQYQL